MSRNPSSNTDNKVYVGDLGGFCQKLPNDFLTNHRLSLQETMHPKGSWRMLFHIMDDFEVCGWQGIHQVLHLSSLRIPEMQKMQFED